MELSIANRACINFKEVKKEGEEYPDEIIIETLTDSMINAFIPRNARLLVSKNKKAENGDMVLAKVNGIYVIRFLKKNEHKRVLIAANKKYPEIDITSLKNVKICGVIINVMISCDVLSNYML